MLFDSSTEARLLGMLLFDEHAIHRVGNLTPEQFGMASYGEVFRSIQAVVAGGEPVTFEAVIDNLGKRGVNIAHSAVIELGAGVYASSGVERLAKSVVNYYGLREVSRIAADIEKKVKVKGALFSDVVAGAYSDLLSIETSGGGSGLRHIKQSIEERLDLIEEGQGDDSKILGIPTGIEDLDNKMGGWQKGRLYVIGGRPGHGKTKLVLESVVNAGKLGRHSLYFSREATGNQLVVGPLGVASEMDDVPLKKPSLMKPDDWAKLMAGATKLSTYPIYLDWTTTDIESIQLEVALHMAKHGEVGLIIVDYLQLIDAKGAPKNDVRARVEYVSKRLKEMALHFNVPVVVITSLNRSLESRNNKIPILSDMRESGQIEHDADVVIFTYRHSLYYPDDMERYSGSPDGIVEYVCHKDRISGKWPWSSLALYHSDLGRMVSSVISSPIMTTQIGE